VASIAGERAQEAGEVAGEGDRVADRRARRRRALEPAVHRPAVRIALAGLALRDRRRDRQRQLRRQHRQPALLLLDLLRVPVAARQPDGQLGAEPERPVVPPVELDPGDRETRPPGELAVDEPSRERDVDAVSGGDSGSPAS
jgi:hypothetical protein